MKKVLVLDQWLGVSGGASKSVLYEALSKHFDLDFISVETSQWAKIKTLMQTFHPDIKKWKQQKGRREETLTKFPDTFLSVTAAFDKKLKDYDKPYDGLLQIGSLFGPVQNPRNVPYFSYSDSTVRNPHQMWPDWMPDNFDEFASSWYQLESGMFNRMTAIMTYSGFVKQTLIDHYGIEDRKIKVVGSALKMPQPVDIDWANKKKHVLFVSTDFKRKGGHKLLSIFEKVLTAVPDVKLLVAGNVPDELKSVQKPWLELLGPVTKDRLAELYTEASIYLHPADYDPFPSVILEAANFEVPAVASNICGIPEIVIDGTSGYLVNKDDIAGFACEIISLLKDPGRMQMMGKNAKKHVHENYHPEVVAKNIFKVVGKYI